MSWTQTSSMLGTPAYDVPRRGSAWIVVASLLVLFGSGIVVGLYVTRGRDVDAPGEQAATGLDAGARVQPTTEPDGGGLAQPATAPRDAGVADVPIDAAVQASTTDAGSDVAAGGDAGSGASPSNTPKTIKRTACVAVACVAVAPRKNSPPAPTDSGGGGGTTQPTTTPPKKCDPFANPKGCS